MNTTILILGAGYTGRILARKLTASGYSVVATSRSTPPTSQDNLGVRWIQFDLARPDTYQNLVPAWGCAWMFPAEPAGSVRAFAERLLPNIQRLVVVGTTSSYLQTREGQVLDESAQLDLASERVQGEECLRQRAALVLRSAGIYGPGRNPLDWLRAGRIRGPDNYVNLVHVEDLAACVQAGLESSRRAEHLVVTDGTPHLWSDIEKWAKQKGYVDQVIYAGGGALSRRLSNARLRDALRDPLTHTNLFDELARLEGAG